MKRPLIALVVIALITSPLTAVAAVKAGDPCAKAGVTDIADGRKFTCVKSGKKLVWNKGIAVRKRTPTPIPTPIPGKQKVSPIRYMNPSIASEDVELCKIKQLNNESLTIPRTGFPRPIPSYAGTGTVKWALVPIDFSDLPGESDFRFRVDEQMKLATEWAEITSEGKLKIEWQLHREWIQLPGSSKDYLVPAPGTNEFRQTDQVNFWRKAVVEADKYVNFKGIQGVHFILPKGQAMVLDGVKGLNWHPVLADFVTNEGTRIEFFSIPGQFHDAENQGRTYWSYWLLHYLGGLGTPKFGGNRISTPFHTFLIQGSGEGERELGGWNRFLLGWMTDSRVYCRQAQNITELELTLIPLIDNKTKGIKLAVIPLTESRAIILESRRVTKFACTTFTERNGVLAYVYDAKFGAIDEYFEAISPPGRELESYSCAASRSKDPLLHEGDKVSFEGVTIELLTHGDFDRVKITRPKP